MPRRYCGMLPVFCGCEFSSVIGAGGSEGRMGEAGTLQDLELRGTLEKGSGFACGHL